MVYILLLSSEIIQLMISSVRRVVRLKAFLCKHNGTLGVLQISESIGSWDTKRMYLRSSILVLDASSDVKK